ncbi:hypothetical protein FT663_04971 [Candidozyma haemuli var. vulneris]|uniref:Bud emergence protein 1 n=1 Tax=Candidozyma haemuli TaxID=45357 RepID=A0A2V1AMM5_9ASCO|nr:hypothetical protein CXQ85_001329 [[Candida] haemuloni]KAF3986223.1 hypothetical protein FT663_04971 [[Candida] haemuloni var. vulneris]KAF3986575.1 hypothetical protein FT662_04479 [[Candida] haemuloni var. vulneris]PVH19035.1 hypothetical protein CXQ85_001329 [[Candida] haemuloni]
MPVLGHQVRNLKISSPSVADHVNSKLRANVILVAKYDFLAESSSELSVKKGDVLKLLDKLSNGWVLVKSVERVTSPGLVPCLYVDIAVNDTLNPITLQWLHETSTSTSTVLGNTTFYDAEVKQLLRNNSPITINNRPYPLAASINNFLMYDNRYWYRLDITYSTQERAYLCRYYQDFYTLHASLLEHVDQWSSASKEQELPSFLKLPKLPEPIPSNKRESSELRELLVKRCKDLDEYINSLISNKHYQVSPPLLKWLDAKYEKSPGFIVPEQLNETNDIINEKVLPGSVKIYSKAKIDNGTESERLHAVLDKREEEDQAKKFPMSSPNPNDRQQPKQPVSRNIYNHYQQIVGFQGDLQRAKTTRDLQRSKTAKDIRQGPTRKAPPGEPDRPFTRSKTTLQPQRAATAPTMVHTSPPPKPVSIGSVNGNPFARMKSVRNTSGSDHSGRTTSLATSAGDHSFDTSILSSPPSTQSRSIQGTPELGTPQIKCEIKTQNQDKLSVRINKPDVTSLAEFKRLIYQKVAFNNLYINMPQSDTYEEMDATSVDLLEHIRSCENVNVLVT